eukprot:6491339-Amphidinium_carterae.3
MESRLENLQDRLSDWEESCALQELQATADDVVCRFNGEDVNPDVDDPWLQKHESPKPDRISRSTDLLTGSVSGVPDKSRIASSSEVDAVHRFGFKKGSLGTHAHKSTSTPFSSCCVYTWLEKGLGATPWGAITEEAQNEHSQWLSLTPGERANRERSMRTPSMEAFQLALMDEFAKNQAQHGCMGCKPQLHQSVLGSLTSGLPGTLT